MCEVLFVVMCGVVCGVVCAMHNTETYIAQQCISSLLLTYNAAREALNRLTRTMAASFHSVDHGGPLWSDVMVLMFTAEAAYPKRTSVVFVTLRMAKGRAGIAPRGKRQKKAKTIP